jgi:hypothetical protein
MKAVKFVVASTATLAMVVAVGCSHTKTEHTSRSMFNKDQDRVAARETQREVVTTNKSQEPVITPAPEPIAKAEPAPAPVAASEPAPAPAPERVAKADRG